MFGLLGLVSVIGTSVQLIKESMEKPIPAENWANKDLYYKDAMDGMSIEERLENVKKGRYKMTKTYPEPHRGEDGRIVIENCKLFNEDKKKYGIEQAYKWVKQGRYNLEPEELEKERERIREEFKKLYDIL
jgi:hypothetical protein